MGWVPSRRPDQRPNQAAALTSGGGKQVTQHLVRASARLDAAGGAGAGAAGLSVRDRSGRR